MVLVGLSVSKGEELSRAALALPHKLSAEQLALTPEAVVGLTEAGTRLCAAALSGEEAHACCCKVFVIRQRGKLWNGFCAGHPKCRASEC